MHQVRGVGYLNITDYNPFLDKRLYCGLLLQMILKSNVMPAILLQPEIACSSTTGGMRKYMRRITTINILKENNGHYCLDHDWPASSCSGRTDALLEEIRSTFKYLQ